jgi:hypothetical protein
MDPLLTRRAFLSRSSLSLGSLALGTLLGGRDRPAPGARARSVIWLSMSGAPSQHDLFEDKPELARRDGEPVPDSFLKGERFAFLGNGKATLLGPRWPIRRHGPDGTPLSDLLPHHRRIAGHVTWVRSMVTDEINHVPAELLLHTGSPRQGRPTLGAWLSWGLGAANRDLPAYVVLASGKASRCGTACQGSGFLPARHQGVPLRSGGEPVWFLANPPGIDRELRRAQLDAARALHEADLALVGDPGIEARIAACESAFRMQAAVPELVDLAGEDAATLELYGCQPNARGFAANCLLARRLVERGVRFVHLVHGGFDHHGGGDENLLADLPLRCQQVDQGSAALVLDLERRGLLESTLVVWGGEFGRTPMLQGPRREHDLGRDHQRTAFTLWLAGGGVRRGFDHGRTDELGMHVADGAVHVHDLQATVLHLLGIDHEQLTFRHQGRDFRLTDVHGKVVRELLA